MGKNNAGKNNRPRPVKRDTKVRDKFIALVNVKTIVTLSLTAGFLWLTYELKVTADLYVNIFVMVISYYFGTQMGKYGSSTTDISQYSSPCDTCPYHPNNQAGITIEEDPNTGIDPNDPNI